MDIIGSWAVKTKWKKTTALKYNFKNKRTLQLCTSWRRKLGAEWLSTREKERERCAGVGIGREDECVWNEKRWNFIDSIWKLAYTHAHPHTVHESRDGKRKEKQRVRNSVSVYWCKRKAHNSIWIGHGISKIWRYSGLHTHTWHEIKYPRPQSHDFEKHFSVDVSLCFCCWCYWLTVSRSLTVCVTRSS